MTSTRGKYIIRAVIPGMLFVAFVGTMNLFLFSLLILSVVIWCWDFWTDTQEPALYVYAVTDNSDPVHVVMQQASSSEQAIALVAMDVFGMHAEITDLDLDPANE